MCFSTLRYNVSNCGIHFTTHCQHVVTLHVWQLSVFTLVVELPEEVEGHHSVEINHDCQQAHCQHQLQRNTGGSSQLNVIITNLLSIYIYIYEVETRSRQRS